MERPTRVFLTAGLIYLAVGALAGGLMAFKPLSGWGWLNNFRLVHAHALLIGFVGMTIFGVAYHIVPRLAGSPLHRPAWVTPHFHLANYGLMGLLAGFAGLGFSGWAWPSWVLALSGLMAAAGFLLFAANMWGTLRTAGEVPAAAGGCGECEECEERGDVRPPEAEASGGCFRCGNAGAVLLPCRVEGGQRFVCVRCLPPLIHGAS